MDTKKPYRVTTKEEIKKARSKSVLLITMAFIKYKLLRKIIKRMKEEGIFEDHRLYIQAWFSYLDQKEFSEKLEGQMLDEIKLYLSTRSNVHLDYLVEVVWNETDTEAWIVVIEKNKDKDISLFS